jgi:type IV pilus assembly protein PilP
MTFFGVSKLHLVTVGLCLLMVGCAGGDQYADIKSFMREVEGKELPGIAPLPEFEPYQPFTYGASNRRSPFDAPVIIPQKTDQQCEAVSRAV